LRSLRPLFQFGNLPARCRPQDYLEGKVVNTEIGEFWGEPPQFFHVVGGWIDPVRYRPQNAQSSLQSDDTIWRHAEIM